MNIFNKILGVVVAGFLLTAAQGFGMAPGPGPGSADVYNLLYNTGADPLNNWFVYGGANDNTGVRHFNFDSANSTPGPIYWSGTATGQPVNYQGYVVSPTDPSAQLWVNQSGSPTPNFISHDLIGAAYATPWSYTNAGSASDVRVYFVDNQAGYNNALGATITHGIATTGQILFPYVANTASSPSINLGDMVEFTLAASDTLNFDIITDVSAPVTKPIGTPVFNTDPLLSSQDLNDEHFHFYTIPALAELYPADFAGRINYMVGVEDLPFGSADFDFNDMIFLVSIASAATPEPHIYILMGSLLALALIVARKRQKNVA
jgi:hypothetical protein